MFVRAGTGKILLVGERPIVKGGIRVLTRWKSESFESCSAVVHSSNKSAAVEMYSVFLVTDREEYRRHLTRIMSGISGCDFLGEVYSREEALEEVLRQGPDIVLVDLAIGGNKGLSLIRELSNQASTRALVAIATSSEAEAEEARYALSAGASGFLRAEDIDRDLEQALRLASRGDIFLSEAVRRQIESAA